MMTHLPRPPAARCAAVKGMEMLMRSLPAKPPSRGPSPDARQTGLQHKQWLRERGVTGELRDWGGEALLRDEERHEWADLG